MITLAVFEGFWGQVFEYLPFAFTVAVTVIFGLITLVYDILWRREVPPPPGALPRIHILIDPRIAPRRWLNRGKTAAKFGCGFGIFTGFFVYIVRHQSTRGGRAIWTGAGAQSVVGGRRMLSSGGIDCGVRSNHLPSTPSLARGWYFGTCSIPSIIRPVPDHLGHKMAWRRPCGDGDPCRVHCAGSNLHSARAEDQ